MKIGQIIAYPANVPCPVCGDVVQDWHIEWTDPAHASDFAKGLRAIDCPLCGAWVLYMLLTDHEREFLAAFIYEATTDPFKGPATDALHRMNIYYDDLSYLMTAYYREHAPDQQRFGGMNNATPPPCPWLDREAAVRRDREVGIDLANKANQPVP